MERYLYKGQCLDACPEAFYHTKERSCERCSDHCRLCTSPTHCLKCNSSYYVSDGLCAKLECGEGKEGQRALEELFFKKNIPVVLHSDSVSKMTLKSVVSHLSTFRLLTFFSWLFLSFFHALPSQGRWRIQITTTAWPVRRAAGSVSCVSHGSVARMSTAHSRPSSPPRMSQTMFKSFSWQFLFKSRAELFCLLSTDNPRHCLSCTEGFYK